MVGERQAAIVFDRYLARARCAIATIAALSLAERLVVARMGQANRPTFENWGAVINFCKGTGIRNKSARPIEVYRYLLRPDQRIRTPDGSYVALKGGDRGPLAPLSRLVAEIAKCYFQHGKPLANAAGDRARFCEAECSLFEHLHKICGQEWFEEQMGRVEPAGASADDERSGRDARTVVADFVAQAFDNFKEVRHADFPSLSLIDTATVACEFHGLARASGEAFRMPGLMSVVREARGWTVEPGHEADVNTIVRDLLWLEAPDEITGDTVVEGLYFSAHDRQTYRVEARNHAFSANQQHVAPQPQNLVITATMDEVERDAHHFYFFFPLPVPRLPLKVKDGIIAGTARTPQQLAAWKVVLIEPDWDCRDRVETLIHILKRSGDLTKLADILLDGGFCRVLYRQGDGAGDRPGHRYREKFRRLALASSPEGIDRAFGGFLRRDVEMAMAARCRVALTEEIPSGLVSPEELERVGAKLAKNTLDALDAIVRDRWHFVEPAQIVTMNATPMGQRNLPDWEAREMAAALTSLNSNNDRQ